MCFAQKSSPEYIFIPVSTPAAETDNVQQHEADASITKNSKDISARNGYSQNIRTTALGLEDSVNTDKKTLLGE